MKTKKLTFLLALTFLFLFSGSSIVFGDDWQDGRDAYERKDYETAVRLWLPLAEQGDAEAQFDLGLMYDNGQGVPQDYKEAVKWYRLSAEKGIAIAQYNLGLMYDNGLGVPQDYKEAVKWYRLAAEQGRAEAQYDLGVKYFNGQGVPQDYKEAVEWYRLSAEQGYAKAQYNLGNKYSHGKGVLQDYVLAHMWWNIAGSNGIKIAVENRNKVENRMTPQQIEKAQQLARNWKPSDRIKTAKSLAPQPSTPQPPKAIQSVYAGTGFLFSSKDYVITNHHLVRGRSSIKVTFLDGEVIDAKIVSVDKQNDIAFLKLSQSPKIPPSSLRIADSSTVKLGDKVFTIGYPASHLLGKSPKYSEGVINSIKGISDNPAYFQISVPIQPGNSGGPLFNERGEVIGITASSLDSDLAKDAMGAVPQNINYAVKSLLIKNLMPTIPDIMVASRGIVVVPTEPENNLSNFIENVQNNVVLIEAKE